MRIRKMTSRVMLSEGAAYVLNSGSGVTMGRKELRIGNSRRLKPALSLQVFGGRSEVSVAGAWGRRKPADSIVAIGAPGAIAATSLSRLFERCLANTASVT
jgi:hypothetical protein